MRNVADQTQVNEAKSREAINKRREGDDMRFILATEQGRRVLWKYLEACGIYKSSFTGSSETYFLEGQRNIGLKILNDIMDADPESYVKMMKEKKGE